MRRYAVLAVLLVGACASPEASTSAGPPPPSGLQKSYAISDRTVAYSYAGGTIRPIPNSSLGLVREGWENPPSTR